MLLWLLPLAALLAGPAPVTTLRGHLAHAPAGDSVRLIVGFRHVSAPLSPAGDFQVALPFLQAATPTTFSYGKEQTQLYLTPGDQLRMALDYQNFDRTLVYSGRGSVVNNYLAQSLYKFAYGPPAPGLVSSLDITPKGTPAEICQKTSALRQARRAYLAAYAKSHPLPAAFVHEQQVVFDADYVTQHIGYAHYHDNEVMPAGFFDCLADAPAQELNRLCKRSYVENSLLANMIYGYGARLVPGAKLSADPAEGPRLYEVATRELGEGRARDWAMEILLQRNLRDNVAGAKAFYPTYRRHTSDSASVRAVRASFANLARVQPGQPAPDFTLTDHTGQQVSLSSFRGKVVYLDFWGTWCGPCMRQMREFAPALKQQFAGRDVVFLYVSVGDAEAKWQQTIADQHFAGANSVHLRAPDGQLANTYLVNGYPSYYLIGRDGRVVQLYAPAPSEGAQTVAAIEQALKQ